MAGRHAGPQRTPVLPRPVRLAGDRAEVPRDLRSAEAGGAGAGDRSAAWLVRPAAPGSAGGRGRAGQAAQGPGRETLLRPIHQVLATLGYGDAIGHEVLGIQRVLRGAGYESEIFVETADHRLEDQTRDYRELVDFTHR